MDSKQVRERVPASARRHARDEGSRTAPGAELPPVWPGLPWMNPWMELWTSMWSTWLGYGFHRRPGAGRQPAAGERRHEDGVPWLPTVERTVIPLRRRTDPPGRQADRISMRVQVPNLLWLGGENVIAFDAVVPRSQENGVQPEGGDKETSTPQFR
jgi:hypothetical protein